MTPDVAVAAKNVGKIYGAGASAVTALGDVSIDIRQGEFFTLLGPSGCGKTTLLRCIAGFETPTSGTILLSGRDITHTPPNARAVNTVLSKFARYANGIEGSEEFMSEEMLTAPEIIVPEEFADAGRFLPTCPPSATELYTAIWTDMVK